MDKYKRIEKEDQQGESPENQIKVTVSGRIRAYVTYATTILQDETKQDGVILLGLGNAIGKALTVSELLRRTVPGLHQVTQLGSIEIKDRWEPLEEGLDPIETVRSVSSISIHLAKAGLDTNAPGYQAPRPVENDATINMLIDSLDNSDRRISGQGRARRPGSKRSTGRPRRGGRGRDESGPADSDEVTAGGDSTLAEATDGRDNKEGQRPSNARRRGRRNGNRRIKDNGDASGDGGAASEPAQEPVTSNPTSSAEASKAPAASGEPTE
mmetsp:Transcript_9998/g.30531  ORF Transcript_9998/g.30531 Transcript_9998/m.30531 type:complete len:269 (+) Transcript_9998:239-1045(+)